MKVLPSSTQKTGDRMMMKDAYASHTFWSVDEESSRALNNQ